MGDRFTEKIDEGTALTEDDRFNLGIDGEAPEESETSPGEEAPQEEKPVEEPEGEDAPPAEEQPPAKEEEKPATDALAAIQARAEEAQKEAEGVRNALFEQREKRRIAEEEVAKLKAERAAGVSKSGEWGYVDEVDPDTDMPTGRKRALTEEEYLGANPTRAEVIGALKIREQKHKDDMAAQERHFTGRLAEQQLAAEEKAFAKDNEGYFERRDAVLKEAEGDRDLNIWLDHLKGKDPSKYIKEIERRGQTAPSGGVDVKKLKDDAYAAGVKSVTDKIKPHASTGAGAGGGTGLDAAEGGENPDVEYYTAHPDEIDKLSYKQREKLLRKMNYS